MPRWSSSSASAAPWIVDWVASGRLGTGASGAADAPEVTRGAVGAVDPLRPSVGATVAWAGMDDAVDCAVDALGAAPHAETIRITDSRAAIRARCAMDPSLVLVAVWCNLRTGLAARNCYEIWVCGQRSDGARVPPTRYRGCP